jgi:hypothetical protein
LKPPSTGTATSVELLGGRLGLYFDLAVLSFQVPIHGSGPWEMAGETRKDNPTTTPTKVRIDIWDLGNLEVRGFPQRERMGCTSTGSVNGRYLGSTPNGAASQEIGRSGEAKKKAAGRPAA